MDRLRAPQGTGLQAHAQHRLSRLASAVYFWCHEHARLGGCDVQPMIPLVITPASGGLIWSFAPRTTARLRYLPNGTKLPGEPLLEAVLQDGHSESRSKTRWCRDCAGMGPSKTRRSRKAVLTPPDVERIASYSNYSVFRGDAHSEKRLRDDSLEAELVVTDAHRIG
jgi:hypothetical protein